MIPRPGSMSFRTQLSLAMGALLFVLLSFVGAYFPARLQREAITLISYKMRALLDLSAFTIHPAVALGDVDAIGEALAGTLRDEDVVYIVVAGPDRVITEVNGWRASRAALLRSKPGSSISADGTIYEGMTTVGNGAEPAARLFVGMSLDRLNSEIRRVRVAVVTVSAAVFAAGLATIVGISALLTRPLREVSLAAERVASGRMREQVAVAGSAEIRRLSTAFNAMIEEVESRAAALQRSHDEMRHLSRKLLAVQEEERVAISREVHDELGQALTILKIEIQDLPAHRIESALSHRLIEAIDSLINLVRRIATELRPLILDDLGLPAAIEQHVRRVRESSGMPISVTVSEALNVDRLTASTILRIVQEALSNVLRHACASTAQVRVIADEDVIEVEVRDDGSGMKAAMAGAPTSLGLLGIRERALLLGGIAEIGPANGGGTLVRVVLPRERK